MWRSRLSRGSGPRPAAPQSGRAEQRAPPPTLTYSSPPPPPSLAATPIPAPNLAAAPQSSRCPAPQLGPGGPARGRLQSGRAGPLGGQTDQAPSSSVTGWPRRLRADPGIPTGTWGGGGGVRGVALAAGYSRGRRARLSLPPSSIYCLTVRDATRALASGRLPRAMQSLPAGPGSGASSL